MRFELAPALTRVPPWGSDEPETLSCAISSICPVGPDGGQSVYAGCITQNCECGRVLHLLGAVSGPSSLVDQPPRRGTGRVLAHGWCWRQRERGGETGSRPSLSSSRTKPRNPMATATVTIHRARPTVLGSAQAAIATCRQKQEAFIGTSARATARSSLCLINGASTLSLRRTRHS